MSALLSFAWRRNRRLESPKRDHSDDNDHLYNHHRAFQPHASPVPPAIVASQSSDASVVTPYYNHYLAATATEEFICIPRRRGIVTPTTPEGLKPRRSISDLRDELLDVGRATTPMIPDILQPRPSVEQIRRELGSPEIIVPRAKSTKDVFDNGGTDTKNCNDALVVQATESLEALDIVGQLPTIKALEAEDICNGQLPSFWEHRSIAVLPPRPSRSWSTEGAWSSPTPASHYSQSVVSWRTTPSAQSPHLIPGQARTAVGNLVALQNSKQRQTSLVDYQATTKSPKTPLVKYDDDWNYSPQEDSVESMFSPMFPRDSKSVVTRSSTKSAPNLKSESNSLDNMFSPLSRKSDKALLPKNEMFSPLSRTSTAIVPAPLLQNAGLIADDMFSPLSRSSTTRARAAAEAGTGQVSVQPVKAEERETEVILSSRREAGNWSLSRGATPSVPSTLSRTISEDSNQNNLVFHALDSDLQRIKSRNQQRAKEELILAAFERLQDNTELVSDVEALMGSTEGMFDWFIRTPLDREGLLAGFSEITRVVTVAKLNMLLNELNSEVPTEEFFLSPSKADMLEFEEAHDDLRDALLFCKVLVQMAIPEEEKEESSLQGTADVGRWVFLPGLRSAIGVSNNTSETPARGGDSSYFSLPTEECSVEAETPMTSNVSLGASTLTTIPTANAATPNRNNTLQERLKHQNGLQLRQAIQVFTTGLQKLTEACTALGKLESVHSSEAEALVRITENIKLSYFQLLSMNQQDIRSLVDAFEFELDSDVSHVYEDTDEDDSFSISSVEDVPRSSSIASGTIQSTELVDDSADRGTDRDSSQPLMRSSEYALTPPPEEEDEDFEYDDLRRQVGSNDYDEEIEEREGPPREYYAVNSPDSVSSSHYYKCERVEV